MVQGFLFEGWVVFRHCGLQRVLAVACLGGVRSLGLAYARLDARTVSTVQVDVYPLVRTGQRRHTARLFPSPSVF